MDGNAPAQAEAPESIIELAIKRLEGNVGAMAGQVKALEEKLVPVMTENTPISEKTGQEPTTGHLGVPIAVALHQMSMALEEYHNRLDELLQRIEL